MGVKEELMDEDEGMREVEEGMINWKFKVEGESWRIVGCI